MSDAKRYYWLKLPETFFDAVDDETISYIEDMDGGQAYVLFYLKLLCKALRTDGYLIRYVGTGCIPYDDAALAKLTRMPVDTVRCAVQVLTKVGLIQRLESGELFLTQIKEFTGSETDKAAIMRKSRARARLDGGNIVTPSLPGRDPYVTQSKSKSNSIEKEKDLEKELDLEKEKELCSELKKPSEPEAPPLADVEALILNTGQEWRPTISEFEDYKRLYPGVDVAQAFRNMAGWCRGNPKKRKTANGIRRFVTNWLSSDQDNATRPARKQAPKEKSRFNQMETQEYDFAALEKALTQDGGTNE
jgi:predicted phage replisome organizer